MNTLSQGSQVPKRFTDTDKWKKPWFKKLAPAWKLVWLYVLDDCDHAGVWHVDFDVVSIRVGTDIQPNEAAQVLAEQIHVFDNGEKWFVKDFCKFQYGQLKPGHKVHGSVLKIIDKYGLSDFVADLINPDDTVTRPQIDQLNKTFDEFWANYPRKEKKRDAFVAWAKTAKDRPEMSALLDSLKWQRRSFQWKKDDGQFIPLPATWLRSGSWDNETQEQREANARAAARQRRAAAPAPVVAPMPEEPETEETKKNHEEFLRRMRLNKGGK